MGEQNKWKVTAEGIVLDPIFRLTVLVGMFLRDDLLRFFIQQHPVFVYSYPIVSISITLFPF